MSVRAASHAGAWYSANPLKLNKQLDEYLKAAPQSVAGARLLIGPHAGYTYAGSTLAETYQAWDTSKVKRVFILGPSHHVYFKNVALLSGVDEYETPFGNLPVDREVVDSLKNNKIFKEMSLEVDEDEHSFEMHAPYIYKLTQNIPQGIPSIVPIMISHSDENFNKKISSILSEYLKDEANTFVISSDFCHWGSRFGYTAYTGKGTLDDLKDLSYTTKVPSGGLSIHKSIEFLDILATRIASTGSSKDWKDYIKVTGNTICGQRPIAILLETIEKVKEEGTYDDDWGKFEWIGYSQSSQATSARDSSVSYASAFAVTA
ncbi:hypothetical protein BN7_1049 [Wickerhamomyces ciferrii]|uniref:MEMO1 family protein n=1 Tax=Wickerhamomyces ciferrii (strain ATCC 14091 / BCRC 22168 / CBS 111 / JCM 3599 / NBRC 0793 / NRRL Y-1031 F-60-10) TaxID=1206466 RepID=K0KK48_WICCF|nr:uncharacterized protein BN7_1049 [Wickerhamomyces ciferrii]CCH41508.1 hypothetical protein BN7_1049 [Wickerhamomyces ciferrii]